MTRNEIHFLSHVKNLIEIRNRMAIAVGRNNQFTTVRYRLESNIGDHTAELHRLKNRIGVTIIRRV